MSVDSKVPQGVPVLQRQSNGRDADVFWTSELCERATHNVRMLFACYVLVVLWIGTGLPNLFSVAGHFHIRKFIAGHKGFCDVTISYCDVTNPLILISFTR